MAKENSLSTSDYRHCPKNTVTRCRGKQYDAFTSAGKWRVALYEIKGKIYKLCAFFLRLVVIFNFLRRRKYFTRKIDIFRVELGGHFYCEFSCSGKLRPWSSHVFPNKLNRIIMYTIFAGFPHYCEKKIFRFATQFKCRNVTRHAPFHTPIYK